MAKALKQIVEFARTWYAVKRALVKQQEDIDKPKLGLSWLPGKEIKCVHIMPSTD